MAYKHKKKRNIKRDRYGVPDLAGDSVKLATWGVALGYVANQANK